MERSSALKKGLRLAAMGFFLAAALLTTGCGQNALMNPVNDGTQSGQAVNAAGNTVEPAGNTVEP